MVFTQSTCSKKRAAPTQGGSKPKRLHVESGSSKADVKKRSRPVTQPLARDSESEHDDKEDELDDHEEQEASSNPRSLRFPRMLKLLQDTERRIVALDSDDDEETALSAKEPSPVDEDTQNKMPRKNKGKQRAVETEVDHNHPPCQRCKKSKTECLRREGYSTNSRCLRCIRSKAKCTYPGVRQVSSRRARSTEGENNEDGPPRKMTKVGIKKPRIGGRPEDRVAETIAEDPPVDPAPQASLPSTSLPASVPPIVSVAAPISAAGTVSQFEYRHLQVRYQHALDSLRIEQERYAREMKIWREEAAERERYYQQQLELARGGSSSRKS